VRRAIDDTGAARCIGSGVVALGVLLLIGLSAQPTQAAGCDAWVGKTLSLTGSYVPAAQSYARSFVFAMVLDCNGTTEVVTVQRATGNLPVCEKQQPVEVAGTLMLNKRLVDAHYEINDPSSVTCPSAARAVPPDGQKAAEARTAVRPGPVSRSEERPPSARPIVSSVWVGRYQDSRGSGDITFTLVRGESRLSGTWTLRTGGGGPLTGSFEPGGRRLQLQMENIAPECSGIFEGTADMTDTTLVATYRGKDCAGGVTDGRLELTRH
jgi:hypothetical protein